VILSTTTSTEDSGLLSYILPDFTAETGWEVSTVAVGTGAALQMGRDGEADVLLVHAMADELVFVQEGYGLERFDVMYNDFVIVGPSGGAVAYNEDIAATLRGIFDGGLGFVSRGDDSGTHKKELELWTGLGIDPVSSPGYISAGQGMGATLGMAAEMEGYCLTDRATWLTFQDKGSLEIVCEKSAELLNYYGVIAVNPELSDGINDEGARAFIDWILSDKTQELIAGFGVEEFGESLFTPNAR
jgi:tungstate transport system substrate-binding protein